MLYSENFKIRNCFSCKMLLSAEAFITAQSYFNEYTLLELINIWNSNNIELYCCNCYEKELHDIILKNTEEKAWFLILTKSLLFTLKYMYEQIEYFYFRLTD